MNFDIHSAISQNNYNAYNLQCGGDRENIVETLSINKSPAIG